MDKKLKTSLEPRNREIMLRYLENQEVEDIAEHYNVSVEVVKRILNETNIKGEIERLRKLTNEQFIEERVKGLGEEAVDTIRDTMRYAGGELKFKAAKDLLDRHPVFRNKDENKDFEKGLGEAVIRRLTHEIVASKEDTPKSLDLDTEGNK